MCSPFPYVSKAQLQQGSTCKAGCSRWGERLHTVTLFQLIQRGTMILVKVKAQAVRDKSASARRGWSHAAGRRTNEEAHQGSAINDAPSHCLWLDVVVE